MNTGTISAPDLQRLCGEVTPAESLMRDHGVLGRLVIIYENVLYRMNSGTALPDGVLFSAADITRKYLEDYHERLEEFYLFPRFRQKGKLVELVTTLHDQHLAGRKLVSSVLNLSQTDFLRDNGKKKQLEGSIRLFERMYGPHAATEDTVLFPAMHAVFSLEEYLTLGEVFQNKENELFGENSFHTIVNKVSAIEKTLGLENLSQFTPPLNTLSI